MVSYAILNPTQAENDDGIWLKLAKDSVKKYCEMDIESWTLAVGPSGRIFLAMEGDDSYRSQIIDTQQPPEAPKNVFPTAAQVFGTSQKSVFGTTVIPPPPPFHFRGGGAKPFKLQFGVEPPQGLFKFTSGKKEEEERVKDKEKPKEEEKQKEEAKGSEPSDKPSFSMGTTLGPGRSSRTPRRARRRSPHSRSVSPPEESKKGGAEKEGKEKASNPEAEPEPPKIVSVRPKQALSPAVAECQRAIFAAFLWQEGLVHDAMASASYLKFNSELTKEMGYDPMHRKKKEKEEKAEEEREKEEKAEEEKKEEEKAEEEKKEEEKADEEKKEEKKEEEERAQEEKKEEEKEEKVQVEKKEKEEKEEKVQVEKKEKEEKEEKVQVEKKVEEKPPEEGEQEAKEPVQEGEKELTKVKVEVIEEEDAKKEDKEEEKEKAEEEEKPEAGEEESGKPVKPESAKVPVLPPADESEPSSKSPSLPPTLNHLVTFWDEMSTKILDSASVPFPPPKVPTLAKELQKRYEEEKKEIEKRKKEKDKKSSPQGGNGSTVCELCDQSFQDPVTYHMKEAHPGCGKHASGWGYNSRGTFCSGWAGNCGDGGRGGSTWYLMCKDCHSKYLALKDEAKKKAVKTIPLPKMKTKKPGKPRSLPVISSVQGMIQNAKFLLEIAHASESQSVLKQPLTPSSPQTVHRIPSVPDDRGRGLTQDTRKQVPFEMPPTFDKPLSAIQRPTYLRSISMAVESHKFPQRTQSDSGEEDFPPQFFHQNTLDETSPHDGPQTGSLMLKPSKNLRRLMYNRSRQGQESKETGYSRVLAFVLRYHDLDGLRVSMKQAMRMAGIRTFAMEVRERESCSTSCSI